MVINLDKYFIMELNDRGFDFTHADLIQIYKASREIPECRDKRMKRGIENSDKEFLAKKYGRK